MSSACGSHELARWRLGCALNSVLVSLTFMACDWLPKLRQHLDQTTRAAGQPGAQGTPAPFGAFVLFCQFHDLGLDFDKLLQLVNVEVAIASGEPPGLR